MNTRILPALALALVAALAAACSSQPLASPVPLPVESMSPSAVPSPTVALPPSQKPAQCQGYVGLTFDDGPSELTDQYLYVLDFYDVHATFFNIGKSANAMPRQVEHMVQAGHTIASHTQTHPDMATLDKKQRATEFAEPIRINKNQGQKAFKFWRPPYGSTTPEIRKEGEALGMTEALWDVDSKDFETPDPKKVAIQSQGMRDGDILLMHDGKSQTLAALPTIINHYYSQGLCFGKLARTDNEVKSDVGTTYVVRAVRP